MKWELAYIFKLMKTELVAQILITKLI